MDGGAFLQSRDDAVVSRRVRSTVNLVRYAFAMSANMERSVRVRKTTGGAASRSRVALSLVHYKIVTKGLHR